MGNAAALQGSARCVCSVCAVRTEPPSCSHLRRPPHAPHLPTRPHLLLTSFLQTWTATTPFLCQPPRFSHSQVLPPLPLASSALPADLDHHNPELRESLVDWLNWLAKDVGFVGWRFDFVRGYAPEYCKE